MSPIKIKTGVCSSIENLPKSFNKLLECNLDKSFFFSKLWFKNFEQTVINTDPCKEVLIYYAETSDSEPLMILPLYITKSSNILSTRMIESVSNYYTSLFSPIYTDKFLLETVFAQILIFINENRPNHDGILLKPLAKDSVSFNIILRVLKKQGYSCDNFFCFGNWYYKVQEKNYNQYVFNLPSKLRNTIKRKYRKLQQKSSFRLEILTDVDDIISRLPDFSNVYNKSWKRSEPYPDFIKNLVTLFAKQGFIRLGMIYLDNKPVATQIWIVMNNVASIYKLAYDPAYKNLSVGTVLTSMLMQYVIDTDSVAEIDYLTGDDPYKKDWMSLRRERWGIIAYNNKTPTGYLLGKKYRILKYIKKLRFKL